MTGESGQALADLPGAGWRVLHDLSWPGSPRSNIDHVAVGPQGVFVIKTLAWSQDCDVAGGELWEKGHPHTGRVDGAMSAAAAVGALLPSQLGGAVMPVLCFVRSEPMVGWAGEAMVCSTENLSRLLVARPRVLDERAIDEAERVLDTAQTRGRAHAAAQAQRQAPAQEQNESQNGPQNGYEHETLIQPPPGGPATAEPGLRPTSDSGAAGPPLTRRLTAREWSLRTCSRRWASPKRTNGSIRRWSALVVFAMLLVGVLRPEVFQTVAAAGAKSIEDLRNPSQSFGEGVAVRGSASRPPLEVVAERPVRTWSVTSRAQAGPGHLLLAVAMTVRNHGNQTWISSPSSTVLVLRDESDASYGVNPTVRRAEAGKVMPAVIRIRPGRSMKGYMVFEVPRGTRISSLELTVGPGEAQLVRWSMT